MLKTSGENKMIKGVSKSIIEIHPRGHNCYERVIIILKDVPSTHEYELIEYHTEQLLKCDPTSITKRNTILYSLIFAVSGALTAVSAVLLFILFV